MNAIDIEDPDYQARYQEWLAAQLPAVRALATRFPDHAPWGLKGIFGWPVKFVAYRVLVDGAEFVQVCAPDGATFQVRPEHLVPWVESPSRLAH